MIGQGLPLGHPAHPRRPGRGPARRPLRGPAATVQPDAHPQALSKEFWRFWSATVLATSAMAFGWRSSCCWRTQSPTTRRRWLALWRPQRCRGCCWSDRRDDSSITGSTPSRSSWSSTCSMPPASRTSRDVRREQRPTAGRTRHTPAPAPHPATPRRAWHPHRPGIDHSRRTRGARQADRTLPPRSTRVVELPLDEKGRLLPGRGRRLGRLPAERWRQSDIAFRTASSKPQQSRETPPPHRAQQVSGRIIDHNGVDPSSQASVEWGHARAAGLAVSCFAANAAGRSRRRLCRSSRAWADNEPAGGRTGVDAVVEHVRAVDEDVDHAGRVLVRIGRHRMVGHRGRIEDDHVGMVVAL